MTENHRTISAPEQRSGHPDPDDAVRAHWLEVAHFLREFGEAVKEWLAAVERAEASAVMDDRSAADEQKVAR